MSVTEGDVVTIAYTARLEDGPVVDTSREDVADAAGLPEPDRGYGPISVPVGEGRLVEGLEAALLGAEAGDTVTATVPPGKGYGDRIEGRVVEYDRGDFTEMIGEEPVEGQEVQAEGGAPGELVTVEEGTVRVDFNHDLAGEVLVFEVEILEVA